MVNCPLCAKSVSSVTDYTSTMSTTQAKKLAAGEITLSDIYPIHSNFKKCTHSYLYAKCDDCNCDLTLEAGSNSYYNGPLFITVCDACDRRLTE